MPRYKLIHGDYRKTMMALTPVDTIFADPPDNIGLGYDECKDDMDAGDYVDFLDHLLVSCMERAKTTYVSFNAKWFTEISALMEAYKQVYPIDVRMLIQGFTFGQHNKSDLANNYRPILRIRKEDAPLFPNAVRIESDRMKMGDSRANPAGRVPSDVWRSDFLEYSRVVGNSKQRRTWHVTQLNEGLVEDCLLMSTPKGGTVIDPFAGTGTTMRVCIENGWSCTTTELSMNYCERIAEDLKLASVHPTILGIWSREIE